MAKIPKRTLATRNPVIGEFMRGLLGLLEDLSAKNDSSLTSPKRCGLNYHANHCKAQKYNR
jgi:hypothetical protein